MDEWGKILKFGGKDIVTVQLRMEGKNCYYIRSYGIIHRKRRLLYG
jgi:hypothetical protein